MRGLRGGEGRAGRLRGHFRIFAIDGAKVASRPLAENGLKNSRAAAARVLRDRTASPNRNRVYRRSTESAG
jgi:hypothetical protein